MKNIVKSYLNSGVPRFQMIRFPNATFKPELRMRPRPGPSSITGIAAAVLSTLAGVIVGAAPNVSCD